MSKFLQWFLVSASVVLLSGCGGGGGSSSSAGFVNNNEVVLKNYKRNFSYDSVNRVTKEDLGNGNYIEYTYDDSGNLISQKVVK